MRKHLIIQRLIMSGMLIFAFFSTAVSARDVMVSNQLAGSRQSPLYVVVKEILLDGVSSDKVASQSVIAVGAHEHWVIRLPALDDYAYVLKISVTDNPDDPDSARFICKAFAQKFGADWFSFYPQEYNCDEDMSIVDDPSYDPENEPLSVVVKRVSQKGGQS